MISFLSPENLAPLVKDGRPIYHSSIGKYFEQFNGYRYLPNTHLAECYPEDGTIPQDLLPANGYAEMDTDPGPVED